MGKHKYNKNQIFNYITKIGVFSALSYLLYLVKFPLPFIFPSFLEIQFSNVPMILGGFVLGPVGGIVIAIIKCLFKLLSTHTAGIGELTDLIVSLCVVIPSSIIYQKHRTKKGGVISLIIGSLCWIVSACLTNAFISMPFYIKNFGFDSVINMIQSVIKNINQDNFMGYYITFAVVPFNLLLSCIVSIITFIVYKRISLLFKKDFFKNMNNTNQKHALIMCDSFKGTMSSREVNTTIKEELNNLGYHSECISISDGGEGFLDTIEEIYPNLERVTIDTFDAINRPHQASFLLNPKLHKCWICLADSVGITHLKTNELDALHANTYGLGLMIKEAITKYHVKSIVLGIGGSASTDAGSAMVQACGGIFYDENHVAIKEYGNAILGKVKSIDLTKFYELINGVSFKTLSDVTNPLCGETGAAYIFGPQKGASKEDVIVMNQNLDYFSDLLEKEIKKTFKNKPGSGAAGGVGYIMQACYNSSIEVGIDFILKELDFKKKAQSYDLIITGEGSFDEQSLNGKVISGIMKYNPKNLNIICGISKIKLDNLPIYSIVPTVATSEESLNNPKECLKKLINQVYN